MPTVTRGGSGGGGASIENEPLSLVVILNPFDLAIRLSIHLHEI